MDHNIEYQVKVRLTMDEDELRALRDMVAAGREYLESLSGPLTEMQAKMCGSVMEAYLKLPTRR